MYGDLTLICGPMFSGKTTELLKRILWEKNGLKRKIAVYKTSFDDRYAHEEVMNHDGLQAKAISIKEWGDIEEGVETVFFDEVQFFDQPQFKGDLISIVQDLLSRGINVVGAGLDMDASGSPFLITAQLLAMADEVKKLRSHCAICGQPATKSYRKIENLSVIQLGGDDIYEPRCTTHWAEGREQEDLFKKQA